MPATCVIERLEARKKVAGMKVPGNGMWLNLCEFTPFSAYSVLTLDRVFDPRSPASLSHWIYWSLIQQPFLPTPNCKKNWFCLKKKKGGGGSCPIPGWDSGFLQCSHWLLSHSPLPGDGISSLLCFQRWWPRDPVLPTEVDGPHVGVFCGRFCFLTGRTCEQGNVSPAIRKKGILPFVTGN